jgi:translation initiation factor eIF-2B subunit gamma
MHATKPITLTAQAVPFVALSLLSSVFYIHTLHILMFIEIHIITPPSSANAIQAALSQNPHLTSLPAPSADVLAPEELTQTSGTAEILRLPEVQAVIAGDFLILPCDAICELSGESLLEAWMVQQAGLGGVSAGTLDYSGPKMGIGGENGGRRGGLSVWYQTKGEGSVKDEETDFLITAPLEAPTVPPPKGSLRPHISNLVYSTTTDTLKDICEEKKGFPLRHGLLRKHGHTRMFTTYRDAHIYLFPHWVLSMITKNSRLDSISEDVVGCWAKAGWQPGLSEKLHLPEIFDTAAAQARETTNGSPHPPSQEEEMDIFGLSTTQTTNLNLSSSGSTHRSQAENSLTSPLETPQKKYQLPVPTILAYIHPSTPDAPLIRRIDTCPLLLSTSLHLATLPPSSPLSHAQKIVHPASISPRTTITQSDCLLADNVTVDEKCNIKQSVIGANCTIKTGARLTRCVLMDGVVVGEKAQLTGCILGRRCVIGRDSVLRECEVQEGNVLGEGTEAKGEKFMIFEGLEGALEDGLEGD